MTIEDKTCKFLVDTGAVVSLIQPGVSSVQLCQTDVYAKGVTGDALELMGSQVVQVRLDSLAIDHEFIV